MTEPREAAAAEPEFIWRLTKPEDGATKVEAGPRLAAYPPNAYLPMIGKALIKLGTQLMQSRVAEDDDEDGWLDDDE